MAAFSSTVALLLAVSCWFLCTNVTFGEDNVTRVVNIYALTTITTGETGRGIVGAQRLFLEKVNEYQSYFLPNVTNDYTFKLTVFDSQGDAVQALRHAIDIIDKENALVLSSNDTYEEVLLPLILGCPWSSFSTATAPVLHSFSFGLMSSSATSVALSETSNYEYFYRTIPSDIMQGAAVIELCRLFGWNKIAVMYVNNNYGVYFAVSIVNRASNYDIEAFSVSFEQYDNSSYLHAAQQIKKLGVFIIVLISYPEEMSDIISQALEPEGMSGYPYYYIGTEGWFFEASIKDYNLTQFAYGSVGTLPWQPNDVLTYQDYVSVDKELGFIYNESEAIYDEILELWNETSQSSESNLVYNRSIPSIYSYYGWDAAASVIDVLNEYGKVYGGIESIWNGENNQSQVMHRIDSIIKNRVQFVGVTGNVTFDENGDRKDGFYLLSNVIDNQGSVNYFSIYSFEYNVSKIDIYNDITWPQEFVDRGLIPQSAQVTRTKLNTLDSSVVDVMSILLLTSILVAIIYIVLIVDLRHNKAMKSVSWKINVISIIGGILLLFGVLLLGIDENEVFLGIGVSSMDLNFLCNLRSWLLVISFSLLFMPLFVKTYRIARIFRISMKSLDSFEISDTTLIYWITMCVLVDVALLTTFILAVSPFSRQYKNDGDLVALDDLINIQYEYGLCSMTSNTQHDTTLIILLVVWKSIELFFGGYAAMSVSQIIGFKQIARFDETGSQIFSVFFTMSILCIITAIYFVSDDSHINFHYILMCTLALLIVNVVLIANIGLRLYYIVRGKQTKYLETAEEKMDAWYKMMYEKTKKIGKAHGWLDVDEESKTKSFFSLSKGIKKLKRKGKDMKRAMSENSGRNAADVARDIDNDGAHSANNSIRGSSPEIGALRVHMSMQLKQGSSANDDNGDNGDNIEINMKRLATDTTDMTDDNRYQDSPGPMDISTPNTPNGNYPKEIEIV